VKLNSTGADDDANKQWAELPVDNTAYVMTPSELVVAEERSWGDWPKVNEVGEGDQAKVGMARMLKGTVTESPAYIAVVAVETVMEHWPGSFVVKSRTTGAVGEASEQPAVFPVLATA
jgi:hypothetical protein